MSSRHSGRNGRTEDRPEDSRRAVVWDPGSGSGSTRSFLYPSGTRRDPPELAENAHYRTAEDRLNEGRASRNAARGEG